MKKLALPKTKTFTIMAALGASLGLLVAHLGNVALAAPAMASRPMTFWYMGATSTQARIVHNLLQPWARRHHVTVTVTPVSSSAFITQVDTAIAGGTLPNLMVTSQGYPDIYALDHLAVNISAVDPALAKYIKAKEPPLLAAGNTVYEGKVYGALESATPALTFVNTTKLKQLRLPLPTSWKVLDHVIIPSLTKHHLSYAGPVDSEWDWYAVLYSFGGQVYSPAGNKVVLASSAGQAAIKAYLAPYVVNHVSTSTGPTQTMADLFASGKYPVQIQDSGFFANVTHVPHFPLKNWEVLPYPAGTKGDYTWTGGTSVTAFNHGASVNREETSLMAYFWSAPVQRAISEQFDTKTATLYTVANMAAWKGLKVPGMTPTDLKTMQTSVLHSIGVQARTKVTTAQIKGMGNTWETIQNNFDKMVLPKATLKGDVVLLKKAAVALQAGINSQGG
ncbi:MAG: extracellular solute-binding protein [Firmicutes bacterium]|nr:extracellular solute-binding protein [Bacillota bacterium]MCL5065753.1 extracellular solute-binding protein [Bacillota bacterium]